VNVARKIAEEDDERSEVVKEQHMGCCSAYSDGTETKALLGTLSPLK
jgi:hypothetical protein